MYLNNQNLSHGLHRLVDRNFRAMHMNLDLDLWIAKKGEKQTFHAKNDELAVLLLEGDVTINCNNQTHHFARKSLFEEVGSCVLIPPNGSINIECNLNSEVLLIYTANNKLNTYHVYDQNNVHECYFGENEWDNTALRSVRTYFDYKNQKQSNLVVGEVISYPGKWSSYVPHYHDQPEIYFFKFDKQQGFGISVAGDNAYVVKNNDINAIESNVVHPVVSAPGYPLYFAWIIRHLENNPWSDRIVAKEHEWLLDKNAQYWSKGKK